MVVRNGLLVFWSRVGQFKKKHNPAQPQRLKKKSCKGSFEEKKKHGASAPYYACPVLQTFLAIAKLLLTKTIMQNPIIKVGKNFMPRKLYPPPFPGWAWAMVRPLACWT